MSANVEVFRATGTDDTGKAFGSINRNIQNTKRNADKLNGSLRMMRGGMGQLGHQIQDVAVQLQMGQNPLMVLTQQGSQVASLFGPTGAVIGAIGAVAGALTAAFLPSLMDSGEEVDKFAETMNKLSDIMDTSMTSSTINLKQQFLELAAISESLATLSIQRALIDSQNQLNAVQGSLAGTTAGLFELFNRGSTAFKNNGKMAQEMAERYGIQVSIATELVNATKALETGQTGAAERFAKVATTVMATTTAVGDNRQQLLDFMKPLEESIEKVARLEKAQADLTHIYENFDTVLANNTKAKKDNADENDSFVNRLIKQGETYKMSVSERMQWELDNTTKNLTDQERIQIQASIKRARDLEQAIEAEKALREKQVADEKTISLELAAARVIEQGQGVNTEARDKTAQEFKKLSATYDTRLQTIMTREQQELDVLAEYAKLGASQHEQAEALKTEVTEKYANERMMLDLQVAEQQRSVMGMQIQALQGFTNFMMTNLQEGSAIQKAFYAATQAAQAAMTIINAHSAGFAATRNMLAMGADPASALATGKFITGVGYAQAAMIVAQTLASFEGGGFTGRGPRSGGIDGRGGFLSVLHPNESVIDHTKGQGSGVTIVNNIDARGADSSVDIKIRSAVEQSSQATIAVIQDLMRRRRFL